MPVVDCDTRWVRLATRPCARSGTRSSASWGAFRGWDKRGTRCHLSGQVRELGYTSPNAARHGGEATRGSGGGVARMGTVMASGHPSRGAALVRGRGGDPVGSINGRLVGAGGSPYQALPHLGDRPADRGVVGCDGGYG